MTTVPASALLVRDLDLADLEPLLSLYTQQHLGDPPLPSERAAT